MSRSMSARVRIAVQGPTPPLALEFHPRGGAVYLRLTDEAVTRTVEIEDGALADYDVAGSLVGLELLHLDDPQVVGTLHRLQARFAREAPQLRSVEATSV